MPPTPLYKTVDYDEHDVLDLPVGATNIQFGDICVITAGVLVPASADAKQLQFFVALENALANATNNIKAVELTQCRLEIVYTAAPTIGLAYGIDDARTLDQSDTTNKLLTVVKVHSDRATAEVVAYKLTS